MSGIPTSVAATAQTPRGLRVMQVRGMNTLDTPFDAHADYTAIDIVATAGASSYSEPIPVQGYDRILLLIDFTAGADTGVELNIAIQSSWSKATAGANWYERACSFEVLTGTATALDKSNELTWSSGDAKLAVQIECAGHFMRLKPYLSTASVGSRVTIKAIRQMTST